ncbi:MAG: hypothetical protein EDS66_08740 [Planctomycetota bacterium]|nr:MAG: hypothetical protein EDS66_08740 [Planctomycetota bacterium]MCQ3921418.1 hypothetical protein [Planctomycetota bacterium]
MCICPSAAWSVVLAGEELRQRHEPRRPVRRCGVHRGRRRLAGAEVESVKALRRGGFPLWTAFAIDGEAARAEARGLLLS